MEPGTRNKASPSDIQVLVLFSGPVASGKTTAASRLAEMARQRGLPAAAIDLDDMVEMVAGRDWSLVTDGDRRRACRATSTLLDDLFSSGTAFIAIAGSTLSTYEWDEVIQPLHHRARVSYVLLRVSLEEARRRAQGDPERIHAKDPGFLARLAAQTDWTAIRKHDIDIETDGLTADEVSARIAARVFA
jgi:adenylylsulfate kinase-like enzyme